ncbi:hypothetical protein MY11210_009543 [Beauveria gryllotalpidicola]
MEEYSDPTSADDRAKSAPRRFALVNLQLSEISTRKKTSYNPSTPDNMPFYEVHHSYPLTNGQRQFVARSITDLHCAVFTTPSFFVHVQFVAHDINDRNYFMAGKPRTNNSNRIIGVVRTSPARKKSDFDALAAKIESAWYDALKEPDTAGQEIPGSDTDAQRLLMVTFLPMVAIREGGMAIPEAGQEGGWLKQQLPYIKQMSNRGLGDFADLLEELKERDDLRKLLQ